MKTDKKQIKTVNSISELHRLLGLPKPYHPMITLIDHSKESNVSQEENQSIVLNFYNISIKKSFQGMMKYGKNYYDFDEGTMSFISPNQVIAIDNNDERNKDGWSLLFHPDLIRNYPLGKTIKAYSFFSYDANEALHLSEDEEVTIENLVANIEKEYQSRIDTFSSDVLVANLDLLLHYCNRFYNRQFATRKAVNTDLLSKFEAILETYFIENNQPQLPTVTTLAQKLTLSPSYLSDLLRTSTGKNTQQHIHDRLIEKAKEKLATTNLSISEIAFTLGFEHSQSFSKLFKNKTTFSPLAFRNSFN